MSQQLIDPPPPTSGKIVYVNDPGPLASFYTMNYDGTQRRRILANEGLGGEPAWSPDGSQIAFVTHRDGHAQIYVMNANGSNLRRLTTTPPLRDITCSSPKWSLDGSTVVLSAIRRGEAWQIYAMDASGGFQRQLTTGNDLNKTYPVWMPRRRLIAFLGNGDIYTMTYDGGILSRHTRDGSSVQRTEVTSHPEHEYLAYTAHRSGTPSDQQEIHFFLYWTSRTGIITQNGRNPTFSQDGSWVAYTKREEDNSGSIYRITLRGEQDTRIATTTRPHTWDTQVDWSLR